MAVRWGAETESGNIQLPRSRVLPIWNDYRDQSGNTKVQASQAYVMCSGQAADLEGVVAAETNLVPEGGAVRSAGR